MLKFSWVLPVILWVSSLHAAPVVTGVSPNVGSMAGGNSVTITGSGFTGSTSVQFGTRAATSILVNSDTSISAIAPPGVPGVVHVTVTAGSTSATSHADAYVYQGSWKIYVADDVFAGYVSPVNVPSNTFGAPIPVGTNPVSVNLVIGGQMGMVVNSGSNDLTFLDLATGATTSTLPVGNTPLFATLSSDGTRAYVPNNGDGTVSVVSLIGTPSVVATIPMGGGPFRVNLSRDGLLGYVSDALSDQITVFSTGTNTVTAVIALPAGTDPASMAVSADGATLYVVSFGTNSVIRIATATNTVIGAPIPVGLLPLSIAIRADTGYVTNLGSNSVSVIDLTTNVVTNTINGIVAPFRITIAPNGLVAYVSNTSANTVTPLNLTTLIAEPPIAGFALPVGVAITRDQPPLAEFNVVAAPVGSPSQFDASGSVSPTGSIANYAWDFGDGVTVSTAAPHIQHTYVNPGSFNVRLTVTNTAGTSVVIGPDAFSTLLQSVMIPGVPANVVAAPLHFEGKIKQRKHGHSLELHATWAPSSSADVAYYEVFANDKRLITISKNSTLHFKKPLRPKKFIASGLFHLSHKHKFCKTCLNEYTKLLHKKYKICAVNSLGVRSHFTHLKFKREK